MTEVQRKLNLSQRRLAEELKVSRRTLRNWINESNLLPEDIFYKCIKLVPEIMKYRRHVFRVYPSNWGKMKGGKIRAKMKNNLTRELRIKGFRIANLMTLKRKVIGPKGEKMYNEGEKRLAEFFIRHNMNYIYEPSVKLGNKYVFPDFLVEAKATKKIIKIIVERCGYSDWFLYWRRVLEKAKLYEKYFNGKFIMVVPDDRFEIAIKRVSFYVNNVIILKESSLRLLPKIINRACSSAR